MTDDTAPADKPKRFTLKRIALGLLILLLLLVLSVAIWLRSIASQRYTADILTLVPDNMALVVEARQLDERKGSRDQIVEFFEALFDDRGWNTARGSQKLVDVIGRDPDNPRLARDIGTEARDLIDRIKRVSIPVGDTLFGPLDPEVDLFSGDVVYATRARPGLPKTPDGKYVIADALALTRVSGRIKIYTRFDSWAAGWLPRNVRLDIRDGYSVFTYIPNRGDNIVLAYGLVGDVFALSNSPELIAEVVALAEAKGHGGTSMFESELYAEALSAAAAAVGSKEAVSEATLRVFTNQAELRHIAEVDNHLDTLFDGAKQMSGGEFVGEVGDELVTSLVSLRAVRATATLLRLEADRAGPTLVADTAVLYDLGHMPASLVATVADGGTDSALFDMAGGTTFAGGSIGKDMTDLVAQIGRQTDPNSPSVVFEALSRLAGAGYLEGELGFLMDDQSRVDLQEGEPTWPKIIFAFRLSERGMNAARDLQVLAALAFELPRQPGSDGEQRPVEYLPESHRHHQVIRYFIADDPNNPDRSRKNNFVHHFMRDYLGPEAEPACAVVRMDDRTDGYFLLATNVDYLEACLDTWDARDQHASVFRRLGGVGVATAWFTRGPAILRGLVDVNEMYNGWRSEEAIRLAYERTAPQFAPPSVRRQLRQQAKQQSGGDEAREDQIYRQLEQQWLARDRARIQNEITSALEVREMAQMCRWFGYQLRAIDGENDPTRVHLRVVAGLGSE